MINRDARIADATRKYQGQGWDPHYLGFFDCFNAGRFYEAHEVLEALWLRERKRPDDAFYKGLIQLAGAFVHWQKRRFGPASALLRLAATNLRRYPTCHLGLELTPVLGMIQHWLQALASSGANAGPHAPLPQPALAAPAAGAEPRDVTKPCQANRHERPAAA